MSMAARLMTRIKCVIAGGALLVLTLSLPGQVMADTIVYACQDGTSVNAIFGSDTDTLTLEFNGDRRVVLYSAVSGSGIRYTGGGYELYGKAKWVNIIRPGRAELHCNEIGRIHSAFDSPNYYGAVAHCKSIDSLPPRGGFRGWKRRLLG